MTDALIISQAFKVEQLAIRCARFRRGIKVVLGSQERKRIGWDLFKAKMELRIEQELYTKLVDIYVTSQELENYLKSQNLQVQ